MVIKYAERTKNSFIEILFIMEFVYSKAILIHLFFKYFTFLHGSVLRLIRKIQIQTIF